MFQKTIVILSAGATGTISMLVFSLIFRGKTIKWEFGKNKNKYHNS